MARDGAVNKPTLGVRNRNGNHDQDQDHGGADVNESERDPLFSTRIPSRLSSIIMSLVQACLDLWPARVEAIWVQRAF